MNFLIIGHSVVDKIIDKDKTSIKPGGIYYTVVSLFSQLQIEDKSYLCSAIDNGNEFLFKDLYEKIELKYVVKVESIPIVDLIVDNKSEREEKYSSMTENLILPTDNLNHFDGILINMISGFDISLTQLKQLRKSYIGLIYFDVHTLSRGVGENLNRNFRRIENFNKWAECIDILQTNEQELLTLSDKKDETQIIKELFSFGINQIIITRAEKGATVYLRKYGGIKKYHNDALKVHLVNKIGCGDVFGAVYFYNYIKNKNVLLALKYANIIAGISTTYSEVKDFLNLRKDADKQIGKK